MGRGLAAPELHPVLITPGSLSGGEPDPWASHVGQTWTEAWWLERVPSGLVRRAGCRLGGEKSLRSGLKVLCRWDARPQGGGNQTRRYQDEGKPPEPRPPVPQHTCPHRDSLRGEAGSPVPCSLTTDSWRGPHRSPSHSMKGSTFTAVPHPPLTPSTFIMPSRWRCHPPA